MRLLLVAGSPRAESRTRRLVAHAAEYARSRHRWLSVDVLDLAHETVEPFRGFDAEYGEATQGVVRRVTEADAILVGSPVFNGGYSAAVKNLFEHVDYKALEGRVAGFALVGSGDISFLQVRSSLANLLTYFRVVVVPRAVFARAEQLEEGVPASIARRAERLVDALLGGAELAEGIQVAADRAEA